MGNGEDGNPGASKPGKTPSKDALKNLPFKQRIALEYAPILDSLVQRFGHVSYRVEDAALATEMSDVLTRIGFQSHPQPDQQVKVLVHNIVKWLGNGHLVMLHYKPKFTDYNLINLLREVKTTSPSCRFGGLVPVFVSAASSQKQLEMFKLLGAFGIRYAVFLSHGAPVEKNVEETLAALASFAGILKADGPAPQAAPPEAPAEEPAKVKQYRELMGKGEDLVKKGNYEDAILCFTQAIALGPNFSILMERGEAYYKTKQFVPALTDFREASKMEKSLPDPYAKIGACCLSLVKTAAETEGEEKARKWFDMGLKYLKDAERIVVDMENKYQATPEKLPPVPYAPILNALAESDVRGIGFADMEEAVSSFGAGVLDKVRDQEDMISDNSEDTRIDRAILLARYGHYARAEEIFRGLVAEDPENAGPAFNNFAIELRKNGQYAKAFDIYAELLKFQVPDREIVVENMKTAGMRHVTGLKEKMKQDEAIAVLRTVLMHKPRHREWVLCELAATFLEMQDQAQASFALMEALYVNPKLMQSEKFAAYGDLKNLRQEMIKKLSESEPGSQIR
ncbi:MAG: tetratricopeptide repeat protein [Nitrospinae bacterium]|nr:tetratricopeptide repeat protein [Nitrospinota bacterium]